MGIAITVYGGAGEIGGNQILLESKDTRLFLDFGRNFSRESEFFVEPFLKARKHESLLRLGLLPNLPGLYKDQEGEPPVQAILLSHAHLDHMDYVRYVNRHIPLGAGEGTWRVIFAREVTAPRKAEYRLAELDKNAGTFQESITPKIGFESFRTGDKVQLGDFEVTPIHVDHSVPAAYGYLLEGPEGRVAYTGDFRFHGPRADMSEEFVQTIEGVDILIMEGTNVLESKPFSETEVKERVQSLVSDCRGLVAASFSSVDLDRLRTFYHVARSAGRELVISIRQACLMEALRPEIEGGMIRDIFKVGDPGVRIYAREKEHIYRWEEKLANQFGTVDSSWISRNQSKVLLFATYYDMLELLEVEPGPGSIYIYSESEPWDEEGEIEFEKLSNWLEFLGMPMFHVHASGHATSLELKRAVERVRPRHLVLVHSGNPNLFRKFLEDEKIDIICPERGKRYSPEG
jgi:ribonuclease J